MSLPQFQVFYYFFLTRHAALRWDQPFPKGKVAQSLLTDSCKPVLEGDIDDIRLACDKLQDIARSGGESEGSWPVAQCAECTEVLGR